LKNKSIITIPFIAGLKGKYFLSLLIRFQKIYNNLKVKFIVTYSNQFNKGIIHLAERFKIKIFDFFKDIEEIKNSMYDVDIGIAVGFGYKISKEIYTLPRKGFFVFHDSLLPKMRGFAPLFWSLILGKLETGLTLFEISEEIDSGDILYQEKIKILDNDDILTLHKKIFQKMEIIWLKFFKDLQYNRIKKFPQNHDEATYCMWRKKEDNCIRWEKTSNEIWNLLRACKYPFWEAYSYYRGEKIYILKAKKDNIVLEGYYPGRFIKISSNGVHVSTGDGKSIIIQKIKLKNKIIDANKFFKNLFDGFDGYI